MLKARLESLIQASIADLGSTREQHTYSLAQLREARSVLTAAGATCVERSPGISLPAGWTLAHEVWESCAPEREWKIWLWNPSRLLED